MRRLISLHRRTSPIWILLLLGYDLAFADPYADCVFRQLNESFHRLQITEGTVTKIDVGSWERGVNPRLVNEIHDWVKEVNSHLGSLSPPEAIALHVERQGTTGLAYIAEREIHFSALFGEKAANSKYMSEFSTQVRLKATKPIFQHEYGHQVFHANMSSLIPSLKDTYYSKYLARLTQLQKEESALDKQWNRLNAVFEKKPKWFHERPDLKRKLHEIDEKHAEVKTELYRLNKTNELFIRYRAITGPYDELFADTIAVIASKDPKSISNAVNDIARDFSANHPISSWMQADIHRLYSPVRSYLYQTYLNNATYMNQPEHVLESLFKACVERIEIELSRRETALSVENRNLRLISAIEKFMNNNGK